MDDILKGKKILIVDDEPDILETLEELLDVCLIDTAPDFEGARKFLENNMYDVAILDIMGVGGYDLLELTRKKRHPRFDAYGPCPQPRQSRKFHQRGG